MKIIKYHLVLLDILKYIWELKTLKSTHSFLKSIPLKLKENQCLNLKLNSKSFLQHQAWLYPSILYENKAFLYKFKHSVCVFHYFPFCATDLFLLPPIVSFILFYPQYSLIEFNWTKLILVTGWTFLFNPLSCQIW